MLKQCIGTWVHWSRGHSVMSSNCTSNDIVRKSCGLRHMQVRRWFCCRGYNFYWRLLTRFYDVDGTRNKSRRATSNTKKKTNCEVIITKIENNTTNDIQNFHVYHSNLVTVQAKIALNIHLPLAKATGPIIASQKITAHRCNGAK